MDEKTQESEQEPTQDKQEDSAKTEDRGDSPEEDPLADAKKIRDEIKAENDRTENLQAEQRKLNAEKVVSGKAEAGAETPKKERLTDTQYAEALERGEVNPLKEDGFIK